MSRSRKKVAVAKDNDGPGKKKFWKKLSNRRFRRTCVLDTFQTMPSKSVKLVDSWDVCDFRIYPDDNVDVDRKYKYTIK